MKFLPFLGRIGKQTKLLAISKVEEQRDELEGGRMILGELCKTKLALLKLQFLTLSVDE